MNEQKDTVRDVRRKLLKAMVYAPPVILGSMVATPRTVMGAIGQTKPCDVAPGAAPISIVISSGTNACCPCVPASLEFDPVKCARDQCIKSCGANCTPAAIADIVANNKCGKFCKNCAGGIPASLAGACTCNCIKGSPNKCN
ncbi:MAG: hypothetical protein L3J61_02080 [Ghiorsea sp.]|nr:hypothetical protein [Ghiorsea sp.]